MDSKLKKCPFCGGEAEIGDMGITKWVECTYCKITSDFYYTEADAIAAWNRRANEPTFTKKELEHIEMIVSERLAEFIEYVSCVAGNVPHTTNTSTEDSILNKCEAALKGGE